MSKIKCFMTQKGAMFYVSELEKNGVNLTAARKKLVIKKEVIVKRRNRPPIRTIRSAHLYRDFTLGDGREIFNISRFLPFETVGLRDVEIVNKIPLGEEIASEKFESGLVMNVNQKRIKSWLMNHIYTPERVARGRASCILILGTGAGKTYIGIDFIREFRRKTLVIVPSDAISQRWVETLTENFPGLIVGEYSCKRKIDGDVVIMVINSASGRTEFKFGSGKNAQIINCEKYFPRFGFVIYDEIHNYSSSSFRNAFWRTNFCYGLGLTATPNMRADDMDDVYKMHMGSLIRGANIPGYDIGLMKIKGKYVKPIKYCGPPEFTEIIINEKTQCIWHLKMVQQMCRDPYRNKLIALETKKLVDDGRNVFIFFLERAFSADLQKILRKEKIDFQTDDVKILMGGATSTDLERAKKARVILTTYGYGWQGVSYIQMDSIIFATPQKSELKQRQTMGRILGFRGDPNKDRIIIDIVDWEMPVKSQYYKRRQIYLDPENDFEIMDFEKIKYSDIPL